MSFIKLNWIFDNKKPCFQKQLWMAFLFFPFTFFALFTDSLNLSENYFEARWFTNTIVIFYYCVFFYFSDTELRKLLFVMVFLSYLGELIFCKGFEMYAYRANDIPLYIPFGHAIVYGSGYVFSKTQWAISNQKILQKFFVISFVALFAGVYFWLNDLFSILLGVLFFIIIIRKWGQNLYFFIALCVIYIEIVGTYLGCWKWVSLIWDLPTINPPVGAVFIYAGGDVLLAKIVHLYNKKQLLKPSVE